jgi:hypothetical protein
MGNHPHLDIFVKLELILPRSNPDHIRCLEDRFESDSLLANILGGNTRASFRTLTNAAKCIDVLRRKTNLVTINPEVILGIGKMKCRISHLIVVIIGVLDEFE